jgi:membrane-bound lytic murein transglycosylase MltF
VTALDHSTADLSAMKARHTIRVLVNYNKTNFFFRGGKPCGYEYELLQQYGEFINRGIGSKEKKTEIIFIPVAFERLIPDLLEGKGDIAAAGLTITPKRKKLASFTDPYLPNVDEILVINKEALAPNSLAELSGRRVHVLRASSYVQHLRRINQRLRKKGLKPIEVVEASKNLETPDILELVNAGVFDLAVSDHHIAELWSAVLPNLTLRHDIKINTGGQIGWAVRKENPELLASLNSFNSQIKKGSLIGNILFKRYFENTRWIKNPLESQEFKKLDQVKALFQKYGEQYGMDWIAIAAQAYQESGLDHSKMSPRGAVGIMQILPSTAADKNISISNVEELENNIHAGVKYLAYLRDNYFNDPEIGQAEKIDFTIAAYNAGPAGVGKLRKRAEKMELDPNLWFFNTAHAALQMNYQETVTYVSRIHKYYIAYKLAFEVDEAKTAELKTAGD